MPTSVPNFNFLALLVSEINGVSQISASYLLCIMQLCEYVFPIGFPLYEPKNGGFRGFEGEDVKILSSNPQKVNTCLLMYRMTKSVQRPEL